MAISHTTFNFFSHEPEDILVRMQELNDMGDGKSWMNLFPWLEPENHPRTSMMLKFLSSKGPEIPHATWVPAGPNGPGNVGLLHSAGRQSVLSLEQAGVFIPDEWVLRQDHTKRGLIVETPDSVDVEMVLDFMISASGTLAGIRTDDRWVADFLEQKSRRDK